MTLNESWDLLSTFTITRTLGSARNVVLNTFAMFYEATSFAPATFQLRATICCIRYGHPYRLPTVIDLNQQDSAAGVATPETDCRYDQLGKWHGVYAAIMHHVLVECSRLLPFPLKSFPRAAFIVTCHRQRSTKLSTTYANVCARFGPFWTFCAYYVNWVVAMA